MLRLRLAPTPSGFLHLGNGVNFALAAAWAVAMDAELVLRVDDLDQSRVRTDYLQDIYDTLHWMMPASAENLILDSFSQSKRLLLYNEILIDLREHGLVYACKCSRKDLLREHADQSPLNVNHYSGRCREKSFSLFEQGVVWRMRGSDIVVRQRNGSPSYQLASLADDVDLGITHIVRGQDLESSTAMQMVLANALVPIRSEFAAFAKTLFYHHALLVDQEGHKLSKSAGSQSLRALRDEDASPQIVFAKSAEMLGLSEISTLKQLAQGLNQNVFTHA